MSLQLGSAVLSEVQVGTWHAYDAASLLFPGSTQWTQSPPHHSLPNWTHRCPTLSLFILHRTFVLGTVSHSEAEMVGKTRPLSNLLFSSCFKLSFEVAGMWPELFPINVLRFPGQSFSVSAKTFSHSPIYLAFSWKGEEGVTDVVCPPYPHTKSVEFKSQLTKITPHGHTALPRTLSWPCPLWGRRRKGSMWSFNR